MENKYYIYVFLDSSKPGKYVYDELSFDYEPFYVGKGCGDRIKHSLLDRESTFKSNKIKKLKKENVDIIALKIYENLKNDYSLDLERATIKKIGRRDIGLGPLVNQTDGGDGRMNSIQSDETKKKISETKKSQSLSLKHTDETKKFLSEINKGHKNPFFEKKHTDRVKNDQSDRISGVNHPMWGKNHKQETIELIKQHRFVDQDLVNECNRLRNSKTIIQYSLDGEFISEYESIKDAADKTGLSESLIGKTCRGVVKSPRKFIFRFKNESDKVLNNSFIIKVGDLVIIDNIEYILFKRHKNTFVVEHNGEYRSFKKENHEFIWEKRIIDKNIF